MIKMCCVLSLKYKTLTPEIHVLLRKQALTNYMDLIDGKRMGV
jgi:hypothetical protein